MLTPEELDLLAKRYLELDDRRKELADECEAIKARIRSELGLGAHETPSGGKVNVSPNRRFDAKLAEQVIPAPLLPRCSATVIDPKKTRNELPPTLYAQCMKDAGEPKVSIS